MRYALFDDKDWLYPDMPFPGVHTADTAACTDPLCPFPSPLPQAELHIPRGGHDGLQILIDDLRGPLRLNIQQAQGPELKLSIDRLTAVGVNENTSPTLMTTTDYASCKDFVTRRAPFKVYDALFPIVKSLPLGKDPDSCISPSDRCNRLALYLSAEASIDASPGIYKINLCLTDDAISLQFQLHIQVHAVHVPAPRQASLSMLNFFHDYGLAGQHHTEFASEHYWTIYRRYVRAQLDMRCTHILLPPAIVSGGNGQPLHFDFNHAETAGQIARQEGAPFLCATHIGEWQTHDDGHYYAKWDSDLRLTSLDGYLAARRCFEAWGEVIHRNNWQGCMLQALADEPQQKNAASYRALSTIFRKTLPGIPVLDAVETTDLGGALDIWVPKAENYEKHRSEYEKLHAAGDKIWMYTCAFPGGNAMNRSMDLPLVVSRSLLWLAALYGVDGYLHWGFNYYDGPDIWHSACSPLLGALLPAGDAHIVYPGPDGTGIPSLRYVAQRGGAEDYELIRLAGEKAPDLTRRMIHRVLRNYRDYSRQGQTLTHARLDLLQLLS